MTIDDVRTGQRRVFFMVAIAIVICLHAPIHLFAGNNNVSAHIAVTPGAHNLTIPPIPDGSEEATITVTITAAPGWRLVRLDPAPAGWFGTYQRLYDGMSPGVAYEAVFSGELEPITTGGGGEGEKPVYTFTVYAEGTSGEPEFRVRPEEQVVCVGKSAEFIAEKRLNEASPWVPKVSNWTFDSTAQPPPASSKTFASDEPGIFAVTAEANGLSGSATLTVIKVDITGFSLSPTWACGNGCDVAKHRSTCQATIQPAESSTITYSIQGNDAHGAEIDVNSGVITPGVNQSGTITVRATATDFPACFDEENLLIRAIPTGIAATAINTPNLTYGALYTHTCSSSGGSLNGVEITENVTVAQDDFNTGWGGVEEGTINATLNAIGSFDDNIFTLSAAIDANDFLPSPPKDGLPATLNTPQILKWKCQLDNDWIPFAGVAITATLSQQGTNLVFTTTDNGVSAPVEAYNGPTVQ